MNIEPSTAPLELQTCPHPIFIIGSPRSGTTILAWSLAQHTQLWTAGEFHLFWRIFGMNKVTQQFEREKQFPGLIQIEGIQRAEFLASLGLGLNALLTSRSKGKRWIDQTPVNTLMADTLAEMFPAALFLHILRDGRNVVNSMTHFEGAQKLEDRDSVLKAGYYPPWASNFTEACKTWRESVEAAMAFAEKHATRCLTIRYEHLASNAEQVFSGIFGFLKVPHEARPAHYLQRYRINSSFGSKPPDPADPARREAWSGWTQEQRATFLEHASTTMVRHGLASQDELANLQPQLSEVPPPSNGASQRDATGSQTRNGRDLESAPHLRLNRLLWKKDRMLLDDLVFRLEQTRSDDWDRGDECFAFWKSSPLVADYQRFLASKPEFRPKNVFELGIWGGGSVAFWFECFHPEKHVAVDLLRKGDTDYFRRYVHARGLERKISTHWGVDQADAQKLVDIIGKEFSGPLDLVIDDASHLYGPTKSSFEALFPLLRPGGLYIIEDWSWAYNEKLLERDPKWRQGKPLADLVFELVKEIGTSTQATSSVLVFHDFAVIERGKAKLNEFKLENHTSRLVAAQPSQPPKTLPEPADRTQEIVNTRLPADCTVAVVSRGDDGLLQFNGRHGWHFPRTKEGSYAGFHPEDSAEAIAHLEALRTDGADFLAFPSPALWWLEYYDEFRKHLETHYRNVWRDSTCAVYQLCAADSPNENV